MCLEDETKVKFSPSHTSRCEVCSRKKSKAYIKNRGLQKENRHKPLKGYKIND